MTLAHQKGDNYSLVDKSQLHALSGINPFRGVMTILMEWSIIALVTALYYYFQLPVIYILVWILIGTRMYALYSLLHDGIHYLLLPGRKLNDWISRLFL